MLKQLDLNGTWRVRWTDGIRGQMAFANREQADEAKYIDAQVPKRHQGLSVGQYMLLAAINRAACPTSKAQLADWYRKTVLTRLIPATADQLSSQAFWQHMDKIEEVFNVLGWLADHSRK